MVALAWFGGAAPDRQRNSFSDVIPPGVDQFEDGSLIEGARRHGLPNPPFYVRFIVGTICPERLAAWRLAWNVSPEDVIRDPRVYHFCAEFERERCRLLHVKEPPTDPSALMLLAADQQSRKRNASRHGSCWI
jgi:hypothetical protein